MNTKVFIVGIGPGNKDYILPKAVAVMKQSQAILGFERAVDSLNFIDGNKIKVKKLKDILDILQSGKYESVSVTASGDPLYYGITEYLKKNYDGDIEVIPGISSFQYMMAKVKLSWQGAFLGSLHGREEDFLGIVKENYISIWFTDKKHSPDYLCSILEENAVHAVVHVGENLSYEDEKITSGSAAQLKNKDFGGLCVVVIENKTL
ncbi:precorrin-6y C5,15-methyltransferase (decarboxylating) subunit CbiE [Clostridium ljungdahlii]|uniref:Putative cobalt-precorrin-6Y C(5)-methyltransferase n=1 Tax=Clostridium ljungdahlii TaxID=1538 RepID=A0A162J6Z4_9CLOT|nr:precorrin-6y C5,15-methyltransferase (decarboxylating) subunit CbiE [Clostridium ljungdahlii]OAA91205.1 putative cobalt-precorrin-6Y C(5)-methyltransferase [Clostridium ljungdahlii]